MLVDDGDGVLKNLRSAVAVFVECELRLMIAKLVNQAFAEIAAAHAGRIELTDNFQRFFQVRGSESGLENWRRSDVFRSGGRGGRGI